MGRIPRERNLRNQGCGWVDVGGLGALQWWSTVSPSQVYIWVERAWALPAISRTALHLIMWERTLFTPCAQQRAHRGRASWRTPSSSSGWSQALGWSWQRPAGFPTRECSCSLSHNRYTQIPALPLTKCNPGQLASLCLSALI